MQATMVSRGSLAQGRRAAEAPEASCSGRGLHSSQRLYKTRNRVVRLSATTTSLPTAPPASASVSIKRAETEDEYWEIADLHCCVFYPNDALALSMLLRLDRVGALATGEDLVQKSIGNFACLAAEAPSGTCVGRQPQFMLGKLHPVRLAAGFLRPSVRAGLGLEPGESDMLGALVVDDLGEHLPMRRSEFLGRVQYSKRKGIAYLSNLCVATDARRQGIARQLVDAGEQRAREWGCRSAALHVEPGNAAAIALYEGLGYRQLPMFTERDWTPAGTRELVLMMKTLRQS